MLGMALIVTVVLEDELQGGATILIVTVYTPDIAAVVPVIVGFCNVDVKAPGPVQLYVAPATVVAVKFKVCPSHNGPLFPAVTGQSEQDGGAV